MWLITVPNICPYKTSFVAPKLEHKERKDSQSAVEIFLCNFRFTFQKFTTKEMRNHIFPSLSCCSLVCTMEPCFFLPQQLWEMCICWKAFFQNLCSTEAAQYAPCNDKVDHSKGFTLALSPQPANLLWGKKKISLNYEMLKSNPMKLEYLINTSQHWWWL